MSRKEYEALKAGKKLINRTDHRKKNKKKTTSIGFCFFTEEPDEAVHWLSGVADLECCVTMEVPEGFLRKSQGVYLDDPKARLDKPMSLDELMKQPMIARTEYCRTTYSNAEVQILCCTDKYGKDLPPKAMIEEMKRRLFAGEKI